MNKSAIQKIRFHFLTDRFHFENRNHLKRFLVSQIKKKGKSVEAINYIFCGDKYLVDINRKYLNHRDLTDIITFELSPKGQPLLADIFISIERVRENAQAYKTRFQNELLRVIFHGALHLCGYKDKTQPQSTQMREQEEQFLKEFLVSHRTVSH